MTTGYRSLVVQKCGRHMVGYDEACWCTAGTLRRPVLYRCRDITCYLPKVTHFCSPVCIWRLRKGCRPRWNSATVNFLQYHVTGSVLTVTRPFQLPAP